VPLNRCLFDCGAAEALNFSRQKFKISKFPSSQQPDQQVQKQASESLIAHSISLQLIPHISLGTRRLRHIASSATMALELLAKQKLPLARDATAQPEDITFGASIALGSTASSLQRLVQPMNIDAGSQLPKGNNTSNKQAKRKLENEQSKSKKTKKTTTAIRDNMERKTTGSKAPDDALLAASIHPSTQAVVNRAQLPVEISGSSNDVVLVAAERVTMEQDSRKLSARVGRGTVKPKSKPKKSNTTKTKKLVTPVAPCLSAAEQHALQCRVFTDQSMLARAMLRVEKDRTIDLDLRPASPTVISLLD
jgi:hypothetical protein